MSILCIFIYLFFNQDLRYYKSVNKLNYRVHTTDKRLVVVIRKCTQEDEIFDKAFFCLEMQKMVDLNFIIIATSLGLNMKYFTYGVANNCSLKLVFQSFRVALVIFANHDCEIESHFGFATS